MIELFRPALLVAGALLLGLAGTMVPCLLMELATGGANAQAFTVAILVTGFVGGLLMLLTRGGVDRMSVRQAFLITVATWLILPAFAALPFLARDVPMGLTNSVFEAMSGLTTTGATVMRNLEGQSAGILLWRAILQWIGGVGILVTAIAILPMLSVGGMQLFRLESSDPSDKILPRATEIASAIGSIYLGLTALCALTYMALGMSTFDAVCHAMTTIATGGFSTSSQSMAAFSHTGADIAAMVFMVFAALPFSLYMLSLRGRVRAGLSEPQIATFLIGVGVVGVVMTVYAAMHTTGEMRGDLPAWRAATFSVISVTTGTGYGVADYAAWGGFATSVFIMLTLVGGCAGSTSCGAKVFRYQVAFRAMAAYSRRMLRPHAVGGVRYGGRSVPQDTVQSVLNFFFVYLASFALIAMVLGMMGLDAVTALSGAATAVANVGPGLGATIGPTGDFAALPLGAKWTLTFGMLIGRLEFFTVLVLFAPRFWRS